MARPSKFDADQILDTAALLLATDGADGLSVARVARHLGAPSGSVYHRFASRDALIGSLWLRAVERFQASAFEALNPDDPLESVRRTAGRILTWCRENPSDAHLLLLYRSGDLLSDGWPADLARRNRQQQRRITTTIDDLCRQLGAHSDADRQRVAFCVIDLPYAAARSALVQGKVPRPGLDAIVDDAVVAVMNGLESHGGTR